MPWFQMSGEKPTSDIKKIKTREQVISYIGKFIQGNPIIREKFVRRLEHISNLFEKSQFFKNHEVRWRENCIVCQHMAYNFFTQIIPTATLTTILFKKCLCHDAMELKCWKGPFLTRISTNSQHMYFLSADHWQLIITDAWQAEQGRDLDDWFR